MIKIVTDKAAILCIELKKIQQFLWVIVRINERGRVETGHGVGRGDVQLVNSRWSFNGDGPLHKPRQSREIRLGV